MIGNDCNDLDSRAYQELSYIYRDEDKDNHLVVLPQAQKICTGTSLPSTYLNSAQGKWIGDCDDSLVTGSNSYRIVSLYNDTDKDQLGAGASQLLCIGETIPDQFSTQGGDCDDSDSNKYQELSFLYRDRDLDNHIVPLYTPGKVCTGETLPDTYLASPVGKGFGDCDDDPETGGALYRNATLLIDNDGDSYGAGERKLVCVGLVTPENLTNQAGDCNDNNDNEFQYLSYNYRDNDQDGHFEQTPEPRQVCSGLNLPSGYAATVQDHQLGDCDDESNQLFQNLNYSFIDLDLDEHLVQIPIADSVCSGENLPTTHLISAQGKTIGDCDDNPESGRNIYRSVELFADLDADGFGAGDSQIQCVGTAIPEKLSLNDTDCNDSDGRTYQQLNYRYRDRDWDKYLDDSIEPSTICSGETLPETYFDTNEGWQLGDCDDDPQTGEFVYRDVTLYTNLDGDPYGTGTGVNYCIGRQIPEGLAFLPNDCDDNDNQKFLEMEYQYLSLIHI